MLPLCTVAKDVLLTMELWLYWWEAILLLRPAFSRFRTFMWFAVCVAGITVRTDKLGVTSIVRSLGLRGKLYDNLLDNFHSSGIHLDKMSALWAQVVLRLFPNLLRVNGRFVLVGVRHQGIQTREEDASGEAPAPGIRIQHQGRVHHGAFLSSRLDIVSGGRHGVCGAPCCQNT